MEVALVVLVAIIVILLVDRHETAHQHARERERLLNAALADNPRDLALLNREPIVRPERDEPLFPEGS